MRRMVCSPHAWERGNMGHRYRETSETDVYHITLRGVGRQIIFEDDADRSRFMDMLTSVAHDSGVAVYAWCLMSNHVHLLLRAPISTVSKMMQRLNTGYAKYFNKRHDRMGTLFQDRFGSVAVKTDEQLLTTVAYIHRNLLEVSGQLDGGWSSYDEYFDRGKAVDTSFVLDICGGVQNFKALHFQEREQPCNPQTRLTEREALCMAKEILGSKNLYEIRSFERSRRNDAIRELKKAGLSVRQIERMTSIGRNIIARVK
jgi:putative transposase